MSINNSYFSKNNTILSNSYTNTGRNPVTELFYGNFVYSEFPNGYSRFIFDLDLTLLRAKIADGTISTTCSSAMTHTLRMVNTSFFEEELKNTPTSNGRMRATSFDLILFRIPYANSEELTPQNWDEGVGYDFADLIYEFKDADKSFSDRPSNWFQTTTISNWTQEGIYNNKNAGVVNYSALTIVDTQHFEFGNENIEFDMTNEINSILTGGTTGNTGWIISFPPQLELITGLTENYSVGFFSRNTQTFYEPFLQTTFDDYISDDRNTFSKGRSNKLYLYSVIDGILTNLDVSPNVIIVDSNDNILHGPLSSCLKTTGVYEITVPPITSSTINVPCTIYDIWSGITYNGVTLEDIINQVVLLPQSKTIQIGADSQDPILYGFDYYGIKQDEKIINTDIRKVGVIVKKAYSTNELLQRVQVYYRIYVKEGQTEVDVQEWTKVNRSYNQYYFMFDTRDKIPNEYYIDLKVYSDGAADTYKKQIKFQIVNRK